MGQSIGSWGRPRDATSAIERRTIEIGLGLLEATAARRTEAARSRFWSDKLMLWAMRDPVFKTQLFRFVDVFPTLHTPQQVHEYLADYLSQEGAAAPTGMELGLKIGGLAKGVMAKVIANRITNLAATFIAGCDVPDALARLRQGWLAGVGFSVDLLGEACVSHAEAEANRQRYLDAIESLCCQVATWPPQPRLETDHVGTVPRAQISLKISALDAQCDAIDFSRCIGRLTDALRPILRAAQRNNVLVTFDMEQHALKELTETLFRRCCEEEHFPAGLAMQAYLRSGDEDAGRLIAWARRAGRQVTVRLVKGAYWDYEVIHAERMAWPVPVWTVKAHTDACFERMAERFLAAAPRSAGDGGVKLAVGSHNIRSMARTLALLENYNLPAAAVEVQMLFGMGDALKGALRDQGLRLREYVPLGPLLPGMAYLVRRLLENTSNESWLRAGLVEQTAPEELLVSPHVEAGQPIPLNERPRLKCVDKAPERHQLSPAIAGLGDGRPFFNEPWRDFSDVAQREHFEEALRTAPKHPALPWMNAEEARQALDRAQQAFPIWRAVPALQRARILVEAARVMRLQRDALAGMIIREAGKTWREADADVCEAIDFCEFYARSAVELFQPQRRDALLGEWNETWHQPRGVCVVLGPWNFPLAICAGMTAAALVTGNSVVLKPAAATPEIAWAMCDIFWRVGVPRDALQFVRGRGDDVGAALVRDPRTSLIAFTGSRDVGLGIIQAAGVTVAGQDHVKKVVCEMGGKNAIIVDSSADLDDAVLGVRQSAFGYSGQKCSACSRAIVLESIHDIFLSRLIASTRSLKIGDPMDPGTDIGPVIDRRAAETIHAYLEVGRTEGVLELACEIPPGLEEAVGKPFVGPHIFSGIQSRHRLANEEVFGPVLAVMRAHDFEHALEIANSTTYKLTGGVYSRKPSHLDLARREFRVGNLYLNRGITGALVGRQPFGGFGLSGTGTQAGGREYLLHFVEPKSCCENTMRHGFAPGLT